MGTTRKELGLHLEKLYVFVLVAATVGALIGFTVGKLAAYAVLGLLATA